MKALTAAADGKSTLVNHLVAKFGLEVGARGVANRDELYKVTRRDTYSALAWAVRARGNPLIWDRLFVSEFVYHDVVDRPCEFSDFERHYVLDVMNALAFPMIVCLPPWETVQANVEGTHQMKGVKEGLHEIYNRYENWKLPWPQNTIWYDYTGQRNHEYATLDEVEDEVAGYLEQRKERQAWH